MYPEILCTPPILTVSATISHVDGKGGEHYAVQASSLQTTCMQRHGHPHPKRLQAVLTRYYD